MRFQLKIGQTQTRKSLEILEQQARKGLIKIVYLKAISLMLLQLWHLEKNIRVGRQISQKLNKQVKSKWRSL